MRSGEEIRAALVRFADRWRDYRGNERSEAHTFIDELFACYGTDRKDSGAIFEDALPGGIVDVHLPGVALIEMKRPSEATRLARHRPQLLDYWYNSADVASGREAPPYLVLCAFQQFEIWEPGKYPSQPRLTLSLDELPDQYEVLMFLVGEEPLFRPASRKMTEQAATAVAGIYRAMIERRRPESRGAVQRFMLGTVWKLFSEYDFARFLLAQVAKPPGRMFSSSFWTLVDHAIDADLVENQADHEPVLLTEGEVALLCDVARFDWPSINPTIFGSLLEGFLSAEDRGSLGVHYTHEIDILKIVGSSRLVGVGGCSCR
jgi:hypothetical protein